MDLFTQLRTYFRMQVTKRFYEATRRHVQEILFNEYTPPRRSRSFFVDLPPAFDYSDCETLATLH